MIAKANTHSLLIAWAYLPTLYFQTWQRKNKTNCPMFKKKTLALAHLSQSRLKTEAQSAPYQKAFRSKSK